MLRALNIAFVAAGLIAGVSAAHAATITYSTPQKTVRIEFGGTNPSSLPQFDPALGTLTGVTYRETGGPFTFSWQNRSSADIDGRVFFSIGLYLSAPGITSSDHAAYPPFDLIQDGGTACCFSQVITPGVHSDTTPPIDFTIHPSGNTSALIGTGTFDVNLFWGEDSDLCENTGDPYNQLGLLSCSRSGPSNLTTTVTYTYDPAAPAPAPSVPEPASAALLLSGLAPLFRRRKAE